MRVAKNLHPLLRWIVLPGVLGISAFLVGQMGMPASPQKWVPFTMRMAEKSVQLRTGASQGRITFVAVREDGSRAWGDAMDVVNPPPFTGSRSILSAPERTTVILSQALQVKTTFVLAPVPELPRDSSCTHPSVDKLVKYVVKGMESVAGIPAVVIEYHHDNAIRTQWKAPSLNCEPIKLTEDLLSNGQVTDRFERSAVGIQLGTPPAEMFAVPANYIEKSPAEKESMRLALSDKGTDRRIPAIERLDKRYYDLLAKARDEGKLPPDLSAVLERRPR